MNDALPFLIGSGCLVLTGLLAMPRARREMAADGRISTPTFVLAFTTYWSHGLCAAWAAWRSAWPLPIPPIVADVVGGLLVAGGATLYLAARLRFEGFRLAWGLSSDRLVTQGIYRYSRNPQVLSWLVVLVGLALVGRSLAGLLLAAVYWLSCVVWLPVEEHILEQRHGETYRRYRDAVPRYFGRR